MTAQEMIEAHLHASAWLGRTPGLERTRALLERLGNPHNRLKFVHIAGTNGKGSTAAMTASILTQAGYRTGLCTSPHLVRLSERFQIDGDEIADGQLEAIAQQVTAAAGDICPTEFELMTAIAFCHFAQAGCDIVVLEVGLGGLLDSTNVIAPPEVAAITAIGLDHTAFLGTDLTQIAQAKGGILKAGSRCALYAQTAQVEDAVADICRHLDIPLVVTQPQALEILESSLEGQTFRYGDSRYHISLLGNHQASNACLVVEIITQLQQLGWNISEEAIQKGFLAARWPGRLERISTDPDFLVDGGHNPQCLEALMDALSTLCPGQKFIFLMGILEDKNVEDMLNLALPLAKLVVAVTPDSPRALSAQQLATMVGERGVPAHIAEGIAQGAALARQLAERGDVICAFGSLYSVGTLRKGL